MPINKSWYVSKLENYMALKKNELMIYTAMWMNLTNEIYIEQQQNSDTEVHTI